MVIDTGTFRAIWTRKLSWRKGYARQQCVYEGPYGRNLSSAENPTLKLNITSIGKPVAKLLSFFVYPRWPSAAILDSIEPEIAPFDPPIQKYLALNQTWSGSDAPFSCCRCKTFKRILLADTKTQCSNRSYSTVGLVVPISDIASTVV